MRTRIFFVAVAVLFVAVATGERPDDVKSIHSDKVSHYEVLDKVSVPSLINYQGYLTDAGGNPVTDTVEMTFSIWDAASGGSQLWDETQSSVSVLDGLFNVLLGSITSIPSEIFTGASLWLQTQVGAEILSPRKAIVSVGHAFRAEVADAAVHADEAAYADTANYAQNAGSAKRADTADYAGYVDSVGIVGTPVGPGDSLVIRDTGTNPVHKLTPDGNVWHKGLGTFEGGIVVPLAGTGKIADSVETAFSVDEDGEVFCHALRSWNIMVGPGAATFEKVFAYFYEGNRASLADGKVSVDSDGKVSARSFETNDSEGNTTSSVTNPGYGHFRGLQIKDSQGNIITSFDANGSTHKVLEVFEGGIEVKDPSTGEVTHTFDPILGSYHKGDEIFEGRLSIKDEAGQSVHVLKPDGSAEFASGKVKVRSDGEIEARSFHTVKTCYQHPPVGGGKALGAALQDTVITSAIDSLGNANFNFIEADSINTIDIYSLRGIETPRTGNGTNHFDNIGIRFADTNGVLMGFWNSITGDFFTEGESYVEGTKTAVVPTSSYGQRKLYVDESAEVYFFDRGHGQLVNGEVTIQLDPIFLETVTIDVNHTMLVQITLTADCNGVFISDKTATSFTVKELMGGTSNATFDWEVAAKRKGYEDERLEEFTQVSR
jgi:hypothetical protein